MKIVNYLHSASMKGEESRQVLYLVGPVGAGKSSLVESLKVHWFIVNLYINQRLSHA